MQVAVDSRGKTVPSNSSPMFVLSSSAGRKAFFKEVLFVLDGFESDLLVAQDNGHHYGNGDKRYSKTYNEVVECFLDKATAQVLDRILRIALDFKNIKNFVAKRRTDTCPYKRTLAKSLETILQEYYDDLIKLDNSVERNNNFCLTHFSAIFKYEAMFNTLNELIENFDQKNNLAWLLEQLRVLTEDGRRSVREAAMKIQLCSDRFYNDIFNWIIFGYLRDKKSGCFFIQDIDGQIKFDVSKVPAYLLNGYLLSKLDFISRYNELKASFEKTGVELLFKKKLDTANDSGFKALLELAYQDISKTWLNILFGDYKLMAHFKALRQYMLLGQGDFIRHLMDVLSKQLDKPADKLARHTLVSLLETAIRATNAQHDDQEILNRIDIYFETSVDVTGWDAFTLVYRIDDPIGTVLNSDNQKTYLKLFKHLWRSKRMEYILANIWRDQMAIAKNRKIPELVGALNLFNILIFQMLHFVQHMNYYFTFDVIECQWVNLQTELDDPQDVDKLIQTHYQFLNQVTRRLFLNPTAKELADQYKAICDNIVDFQKHFTNIWKAIESEMDKRDQYNETEGGGDKKKLLNRRTVDQLEMDRRTAFVNDTITKAKAKVILLTQSFQDLLQKFLIMLAYHPQRELRELSLRLSTRRNYV